MWESSVAGAADGAGPRRAARARDRRSRRRHAAVHGRGLGRPHGGAPRPRRRLAGPAHGGAGGGASGDRHPDHDPPLGDQVRMVDGPRARRARGGGRGSPAAGQPGRLAHGSSDGRRAPRHRSGPGLVHRPLRPGARHVESRGRRALRPRRRHPSGDPGDERGGGRDSEGPARRQHPRGRARGRPAGGGLRPGCPPAGRREAHARDRGHAGRPHRRRAAAGRPRGVRAGALAAGRGG